MIRSGVERCEPARDRAVGVLVQMVGKAREEDEEKKREKGLWTREKNEGEGRERRQR